MKRFLIAAPGYIGDAELLFDANGKLIRIDISKTNMGPLTLEEFKQRSPVHLDNIHAAFADVKATITEASIIVTFEQFWNRYNKKIKPAQCKPLWAKLSENERVKAYVGITAYDKFLQRESWRSKADPVTYLRNKYWENEYK